jgi:hypothetical protein
MVRCGCAKPNLIARSRTQADESPPPSTNVQVVRTMTGNTSLSRRAEMAARGANAGPGDVEQVAAFDEAAQGASALDRRVRAPASAPTTAEHCRRICRGTKSSSSSTTRPAPCCKGELHRIGEDKSERLDLAPAQFRILITRRPKYACRSSEDGIMKAPTPARLLVADRG